MKKLIPIMLTVAALGFSVPTVKSVITGEPHNAAFLVLALAFLALALFFFIVGHMSGGGAKQKTGS